MTPTEIKNLQEWLMKFRKTYKDKMSPKIYDSFVLICDWLINIILKWTH